MLACRIVPVVNVTLPEGPHEVPASAVPEVLREIPRSAAMRLFENLIAPPCSAWSWVVETVMLAAETRKSSERRSLALRYRGARLRTTPIAFAKRMLCLSLTSEDGPRMES